MMQLPLDYASSYVTARADRRRGGFVPWLALAGSMLIWIIPFTMLAGILSALSGLLFLPYMGWLAIPAETAFVVYAVYRWVTAARRRNGRIILGYLELAVRLNLPLVPFLFAAERSESGRRARQIARVRAGLASGGSVADALSDALDVPDEVVSRVQAAEPLGQLREALTRSAAEERRAAEEAAHPDATLYRFYPLFMFFGMWILLTLLLIFVIPKFREIFKDFKTTLPPLTEFVLGVGHTLEVFWPLTVLVFLGLFGTALLLMSVCATRTFMPFMPLPDFRRISDWIAWRLPIARTIHRDRALAETCALLATATRGGVALPDALLQAMSLPVNAGFREQLIRFRRRLLEGQTPADAANSAKLPHLMAGLLAPVSSGSPDPGTFTFLERYYRDRFSRTYAVLRGFIGPSIVFTFAVLVGGVVLSLFLPLVKLIASVSGAGHGGML
jgi:type IV pilus assembly protein PilC